MAVDTTASQSNGIKPLIDTIVAPKDAFTTLRIVPTWGWAFLIAFVLMVAGYYLQRPATVHATVGTLHHMFQTSAIYASMPDAKKQQILDSVQHPPAYQQILGIVQLAITLLIAALFNALILLVGSNLGRGSATFKQLWAGSMNIAVPSFGFGSIIIAIVCIARGPENFNSIGEIFRSVPSAFWLAPNSTGSLAGTLSGISIFMIWGCGLNVVMMRVLAGVKGALAWVFPIAVLVLTGVLTGAVSSLFGG